MTSQNLMMYLANFIHNIQANGIRVVFRDYIYIEKKLIPVEKDLRDLKPLKISDTYRDHLLKHITKSDLDKYSHKLKNRKLRAVYYLNMGYQGYVILRDDEILGDIWYWSPSTVRRGMAPNDLQWLKLKCNYDEVYAFDFFLNPIVREHNLSAFFFNSFFHALAEKGINKLYGYFWADNIPALWVHRLVGFKEFKPLYADRFLFFKRIRSTKI
jgi:hypothetical protein